MVELEVVGIRDVVHRPGEQFRLAVAHELAHRGVGAEETAASGLNLDLAYAADVEHGAEGRFALAQRILRRLSPGGGPAKLRHQRVDLNDGGFVQWQRTARAQSDCSASRVTDRVRDNPAQPQS